MAGERRHFPHGDVQIGVGIAGCIGEGRFFQTDFAGALGQHGAEFGFIAAERLGYGDAGIVGGVDNDAVDEVVQFHPAVDGRKHCRAVRWRPALAPGVLTDGEFSVELEAALLDFVEHEFEGHELGKARGRHQLVAVLLEQNAVAVGIEQEALGTPSLKGLVLFGGHVRGGVRTDNGGQQTDLTAHEAHPGSKT